MKKFISLLVMLCMLITIIPLATTAAEETEIPTPTPVEEEDTDITPNPDAYPNFATDNWEALYAHATLGGDSDNAWQKWMKDYTGFNAEEGIRYFFLPKSADDELIEIYNGYSEDAVIGDVTIPTHTSAFIEYTEDTPISVKVGENRSYTFKVLRSDAEAALYINDTTNSYEDFEGNTQNTDLWSFLIQNKENSCSTATYSIASESGTEDGNLKKIKGRGNTNWKESDKKPFNINFSDKVTIGHTESKKFSLVANPKDSTMLRNTIMYNLAHDVGNPYSSDQSFIDFYVNGVYRGTYIACQKIDLGKNSVVSLKDESEDKETDFNFLVEVDVWNYKNDTYFVSDKGYHVVLKTPDLEDFETNSDAWQVRYDYIKDKYQELEDALYNGTLADIEAICDLESLASQYLLQDLGKNCDGGYTSTFFTYNAAEGKFYAAPIWDCDSHLGAVDVWRDNCTTSTSDHTGWTTRLAKYERTINPLGQAFYVKGTSSKGQTFEELCKEIWTETFLPKIDVLLGKAEPAEGDRGMSIDDYAKSIEKTTYINYIMWDFMWLCQDKNKSLTDIYTDDVAGELQYMKDWLTARTEWITANLGTGNSNPSNPSDPDSERVVYFTTDLGWDDVHYYIWGDGHIPMRWPGEKAELTDMTVDGNAVYKITITDSKANMIIFNNGSNGAQTEKTQIPNTPTIYNTTDPSGRTNEANMPYYNTASEKFTEPVVPSNPASSVSPSTAPSTAPSTVPSSAPASSNPGSTATKPTVTLMLGDVDKSQGVNVKDATLIQKHLADLVILDAEALSVADTNKDSKISVSDATTIQKFVADIIPSL